MKTVGIIAEYNPFHNGHLYQLKKAKEITGADFAVVVMSGDFTQRGTPAVFDKYTRCRLSLLAGADLCIELPVVFATASAELFAKGAVSLLSALGVDALCFGSECGEIAPLREIASLLFAEPPAYKEALNKALKEGLSFPSARALAVRECAHAGSLSGMDAAASDSLSGVAAAASDVLASPNNILGIEYLKALLALEKNRQHAPVPYTIKREGDGYLSHTLSEESFCSAMALRKGIAEENPDLLRYVPESIRQEFSDTCQTKSALCADDFSGMLFYKLLSEKDAGYDSYLDVSSDLSDKIRKNLGTFTTFSAFCENSLKSKDITLTRVYRSLLHILLSIKKEDLPAATPYARILGFREASFEVFGCLSKENIPLLSRLKDASSLLSPEALSCLSKDIFAAQLYEHVRMQHMLHKLHMQKDDCPFVSEYSRPVIRIS
ncbi:MAG: nucleotidyltransferase family protein [Lachnospiraceae bacterium]|nr:nucleotidyltransferase family protein [Lachnospiraceae bacterium]